MPRPERPVGPGEGPTQRFAVALRDLRRSAGNPTYRVLAKRAHYAATTLAQAAAGERLPSLDVALAYARACGDDTTEWTARWRVAAAELDTAGSMVDPASDPGLQRSPYLGLAAYGPPDADRFCGRDALVAALTDRLDRQRFVAVVGASGSGKSSLLRAGLLPAARADGDRWSTVLMSPGAHPLRECADQLATRLGCDAAGLAAELAEDPQHLRSVLPRLLDGGTPDARCLMIVDQFEEVFSLCADAAEREAFIRAILAAANDPDSCTRVVIGLRADFYAHSARLPELVAALQDAQLIVGPMTPEELSVAITEPATRAGLMVERALVATIVAEAASRPAVLPFVSHALWETWRRRRGTGLFLAGYQAAGGLDGAVAQSAERVYAELDEEHRRGARRILLRLTALGDGTEDTRRRVARTELGDAVVTTRVVERLAAARLLTIGEGTVEIAHEALIRGWPTLRDWLAADRETLRAHHRLAAAATDWAAHDRDDAFLYQGSLLAGWSDRDDEALNETERVFLAASRAQVTRDQWRRRRRLRTTIGALVAGLVTVCLLAVIAAVQTADANAQRDLAVANGLAAQARAMLPTQPDLGNLLALAGLDHAVTAQTVASAQAALSVPVYLSRPLVGHSGPVNGTAFSPDGRTIVTGGDDGTVRLWNSTTTAPPVVLHAGSSVKAVAFSHDGRLVAAGGADGAVRLWDTTTYRSMGELPGGTAVNALAFSPDGTTIATGGKDGNIRIWDVEARRPVATVAAQQGVLSAVAFSPDGRTLATGGEDNTVKLWQWDTSRLRPGRTLLGHTAEVFAAAFSPDGTTLVTGSADGSARIWSVRTGTTIHILNRHARPVSAVAFAADGRTIATASWDGTARLWSAATGQQLFILTGHTDQVLGVAIAPDGRSIVTAGRDGVARIWDTTTSQTIVTLQGHTSYVDTVAVSPDGHTIATGSRDGTVRLWDTAGHQLMPALDAKAGFVLTVAFSPDGHNLATGNGDGTIRLWDTRTHQQIKILPRYTDSVAALAFSPDGRLLAGGSVDGTARLWDTTTWRYTPLPGHTGWVDALAFTHDGSTLATAATDGTVQLWDLRTVHPITTRNLYAGYLTALAFSPDGTTLAIAPSDGTVRLWNIASGKMVKLTGHTDTVTSIAYSPDGRSIATSSRDGTARLWDLDSHRAPLTFTQNPAWVTAVAFNPDGKTLATTSWDHTARLTPIPPTWPAELCRRAGRNLSRSEWTFYLGSAPYERLCPEFPSGQGANPSAPIAAFPNLGY